MPKGKAAPPFERFVVAPREELFMVKVEPYDYMQEEAQRSFIESAIQEALAGGWRDCKVELPPANPKKGWRDGPNHRDEYKATDVVLAFNGCITTAEALTNPQGEIVWVCGDETVEHVTHWRPLPAAPGEEEEREGGGR